MITPYRIYPDKAWFADGYLYAGIGPNKVASTLLYKLQYPFAVEADQVVTAVFPVAKMDINKGTVQSICTTDQETLVGVEKMLEVRGVGFSAVCSLLSRVTESTFKACLQHKDPDALALGKGKRAQDVLAALFPDTPVKKKSSWKTTEVGKAVVTGLVNMGYTKAQASEAVEKLEGNWYDHVLSDGYVGELLAKCLKK